MRTVIAVIYDYSLDGVSAEEGTRFFEYCRALPDDEAQLERALDMYRNADLILMGRTHYQSAAQYFPTAGDDDPYAAVLNPARKVVFSHTLTTADWSNTSIAGGDLAAEVEKLRLGGDGYLIADGGLGFLRSLIRHDLIDEFRVHLVPYLASTGPRLFDGLERPAALELVSVAPVGGGINELVYRLIR
jgi:dihydrofolate reductase